MFEMLICHWFSKMFRRVFESRVWNLGMSGLESDHITFGFIRIMEQTPDCHGFCELEIVYSASILQRFWSNSKWP